MVSLVYDQSTMMDTLILVNILTKGRPQPGEGEGWTIKPMQELKKSFHIHDAFVSWVW
jgi:hypothetical protein